MLFGVGDRTCTLLKVATGEGLERSAHLLGSLFRHYDGYSTICSKFTRIVSKPITRRR